MWRKYYLVVDKSVQHEPVLCVCASIREASSFLGVSVKTVYASFYRNSLIHGKYQLEETRIYERSTKSL